MREMRLLLWLCGLLALLGGLWLLSTWEKGDQLIRQGDTVGWLAFVSDREGPTHIWFRKADGSEVRVEPKSNSQDLDPTWRNPDGGSLVFTSNRTERVDQVFEISPVDAASNQLTQGGGRKSNLVCSKSGERLLLLAGGLVSIFEFKKKNSEQIVPPPTLAPGEAKAMMEQWKADFGSSAFKKVVWGGDEQTIVGVIRGDTDEVLIVQAYDRSKRQQQPPKVVLFARRIDIAYHPNEAMVAVCFWGAHQPAGTENLNSWRGASVSPKEGERTNGLVILDVAKTQTTPLYLAPEAKEVLMEPSWSPDGSELAVIRAKPSGEDVDPNALLILSMTTQGQSTLMDEGRCGDPNWSADGKTLAYTKGPGGAREIWTVGSDGSNPQAIVKGKGDNFSPRWSPAK